MRTLHLLRHAQAVSFQSGATDHQRPLTERGREQAAAVGEFLRSPAQAGRPAIDSVLCSTSTRTRQTLDGLALNCPVVFSDGIYNASPDELLSEIAAAEGQSLLVIGHSPAIPSLAGELADSDSDPDLVALIESRYPPASLSLLQVDTDWPSLRHAALIGVRLGS